MKQIKLLLFTLCMITNSYASNGSEKEEAIVNIEGLINSVVFTEATSVAGKELAENICTNVLRTARWSLTTATAEATYLGPSELIGSSKSEDAFGSHYALLAKSMIVKHVNDLAGRMYSTLSIKKSSNENTATYICSIYMPR